MQSPVVVQQLLPSSWQVAVQSYPRILLECISATHKELLLEFYKCKSRRPKGRVTACGQGFLLGLRYFYFFPLPPNPASGYHWQDLVH